MLEPGEARILYPKTQERERTKKKRPPVSYAGCRKSFGGNISEALERASAIGASMKTANSSLNRRVSPVGKRN